MHFGLERMHALLGALGRPERGRGSIHVVGSNGKSSTTRFAAALLRAEGFRVGAYLSPHLGGWHERVEVDGEPVPPETFAEAVLRVAEAAVSIEGDGSDAVTQFEGVTAAAFLVFSEADCDWQVIEAGLGGRWDATNVLDGPDAVAVTSISLEHTGLLGTTHLEIAREKLAVALEGSGDVVIGPLDEAAVPGVVAAAREKELRPIWVEEEVAMDLATNGVTLRTPLGEVAGIDLKAHGRFQVANAATALRAVEVALGRAVGPGAAAALGAVEALGRLERVPGLPALVIDGAHNPSGAEALAAELEEALPAPRVAVLALLDDKDLAGVLRPLAGVCDALYATASLHPRSRDPQEIAQAARDIGMTSVVVSDPADAVLRARRCVGQGGGVVVCGSLYLLRDLRQAILADVSKAVAMLAPVPRNPSPGA